jgi:hypothetical protein
MQRLDAHDCIEQRSCGHRSDRSAPWMRFTKKSSTAAHVLQNARSCRWQSKIYSMIAALRGHANELQPRQLF